MYAPHPGQFSSSSNSSAEQSCFAPYSSWMPNVTRPPPPPADPYQSNRLLPPAPQMFHQGVGDRSGFNQGFGDRTGFFRCETNRQGNGQWKKLMMEMKGLEEKKTRVEEQHLQEGQSGGMSLQERRLQQEETLLGRRFREERDRNQRFDQQEGWVNEQRHEKAEWRAEKKLKLEEARELDRMWDMVKRRGKYEGCVPETRIRNWPEESGMGSDLNRGEQEVFKGRRTPDLSVEIAERERELRKREEKLRQEERKLDEIYRAEKERNLREREERLRRKERELEEFSSARKSGRSAAHDNLGSREWSRSSDRSSSLKYDEGRSSRKLNHDHEERSGKLEVDDELTLEISIPNQPGDLRWQDDRGRREMSRSRSVSSRGESGVGSRDVRSVNYDHNEMQKQLTEKDEREFFGRSGARRLRRNRSRRHPSDTYRMTRSSQNGESPLRQPSETSSRGFRDEDEAVPRAPVKSRLGVKRGVKERLGKRSKLAKQEMERDLSTVQFEGRVIAELQERPLDLVEDGEDFNMFDQEEEDGWSEEEDFYEEELQ